MTSFEPAMPPIPVSCGAAELRLAPSHLEQLREGSHYRVARTVLKLLFASEVIAVLTTLVVLVATKRTSSPLLAVVAGALLIGMSYVGVELVGAMFDLADVSLEIRFKHPTVLPGR